MTFDRPIRLGSLELPNRAFLAPLAAVSDIPFRRVCRELGAGLTFVEMLSAEAILRRSPRTLEMMARHPDEPHLGVQLTGTTPEQVAAAIAFLDERGFDAIDVNMGCPV
ncbi:MAG: tRNA-dihydrouridine synthase, partial [Candidatus Binatia bacterium]